MSIPPVKNQIHSRRHAGRLLPLGCALCLACGTRSGAQTAVVTHAELQATDSVGYSADATNYPFVIQGVLINDPEEMLDTGFNPGATDTASGAQYQVFIQSTGTGDRGGTALWMAQYNFIPGQIYEAADWSNEMVRVRTDTNSRAFRKGDQVEVTARKTLFFGGKRNINEGHLIDPSFNFDLALVKANAGLPQAEVLTLSDLVTSGTNQLFDSTRTLGGEHWQGMRVRLDGIRLATTNGWGKTNWSDRLCTAVDNTGRALPLRMPLTDLGAPPATSAWFSAVGILNQESGSSTAGTNGYELFVQEIGPVLNVGTNITGSQAVSYSSDYEGYVLEASDDGLQNWGAVDITPKNVIVIEDDSVSPNRAYRLRKID